MSVEVPAERAGSDWQGLVESLKDEERTAGGVERAERWGQRRLIALEPAAAIRSMIPTAFQLVTEAIGEVHGALALDALAETRAVLVKADYPIAGTSFRDVPIIVVNTGFLSLVTQIDAVVSSCTRGLTADDVRSCVAALRFLFIQETFHELSGTHGLAGADAIRDSPLPRVVPFVLAHEAAHVVLEHEHKHDSEKSRQQELEADAFAWPVYRWLERRTSLSAQVDTRPVAIALMAADAAGRYPFVRVPATHPDIASRLGQLFELAGHRTALESPLDQTRQILELAVRMDTSLGEPTWDAFVSSKRWRHRDGGSESYVPTRALDHLLGLPWRTLRDLASEIPGLHSSGFNVLLSDAWSTHEELWRGLDAAKVESQSWFDARAPLMLSELVDGFLEAECLSDWTSTTDKRMVSSILALMVRNLLIEEDETRG